MFGQELKRLMQRRALWMARVEKLDAAIVVLKKAREATSTIYKSNGKHWTQSASPQKRAAWRAAVRAGARKRWNKMHAATTHVEASSGN